MSDKTETTCPKCGNEMVYKVPSPAKTLHCVHCPVEYGIVEEPAKSFCHPLFVKKGRDGLDHLSQGGLIEKTIWVTYYPETGRVETKVDSYV